MEQIRYSQTPKDVLNCFKEYYLNNHYRDIYLLNTNFKDAKIKFIPWIIQAWFDHYQLTIHDKKYKTEKNIPFIIYQGKLFYSPTQNIVDLTELEHADIRYLILQKN